MIVGTTRRAPSSGILQQVGRTKTGEAAIDPDPTENGLWDGGGTYRARRWLGWLAKTTSRFGVWAGMALATQPRPDLVIKSGISSTVDFEASFCVPDRFAKLLLMNVGMFAGYEVVFRVDEATCPRFSATAKVVVHLLLTQRGNKHISVTGPNPRLMFYLSERCRWTGADKVRASEVCHPRDNKANVRQRAWMSWLSGTGGSSGPKSNRGFENQNLFLRGEKFKAHRAPEACGLRMRLELCTVASSSYDIGRTWSGQVVLRAPRRSSNVSRGS
ncbi:uncharacterized protein BDZ83DRAFT_654532 [Colletotrichum acutatum]|uniref:Uncharacterized protein n=1 Tax=Glomerella acutata TaxID=27357 RepID=A0AAD8UHK4_GLOAC|nr:uncharacterized protein BDZ83DRAFT_654532 [Colletotrichum acutatum]KAK1720232.1 hypothetical protein BDZ83DRAFT_654532 [Colletotrichum acutatum]